MSEGRSSLEMRKPLTKLPSNVKALVEELRECFPPLRIYPGMTPDEMMFAAGARELISILEERLAAQAY